MKLKHRLFGVGIALLGATAGIPVGMATSNAQAEAHCVTRMHYQPKSGNAGWIKDWVTCGGGDYKFRARAECFPDKGHAKPTWRSGSWRTQNNQTSTAGCKNGTYIDNGGYNVGWNNKYYVLWRKGGTPV